MKRKNTKKEKKKELSILQWHFFVISSTLEKNFLGGELFAKNRHCIYRGVN